MLHNRILGYIERGKFEEIKETLGDLRIKRDILVKSHYIGKISP